MDCRWRLCFTSAPCTACDAHHLTIPVPTPHFALASATTLKISSACVVQRREGGLALSANAQQHARQQAGENARRGGRESAARGGNHARLHHLLRGLPRLPVRVVPQRRLLVRREHVGVRRGAAALDGYADGAEDGGEGEAAADLRVEVGADLRRNGGGRGGIRRAGAAGRAAGGAGRAGGAPGAGSAPCGGPPARTPPPARGPPPRAPPAGGRAPGPWGRIIGRKGEEEGGWRRGGV